MAVGAPWLAPSDPVRTDWSKIRKAPSWAHPFGTDDLGRDGSRAWSGAARISMQAGVFSILLAMLIGVPVGLCAGYYRGALDQLDHAAHRRLAGLFRSSSSPSASSRSSGPSLTNATLAIGPGATPTYIRLTRGLVLSVSQEDYVSGARALGAGDLRVMARHILPNIVSAILVQATVAGADRDHRRGVLSFLGLGVQPPAPSWGTMLNAAQQFLEQAPWMAYWPGLADLRAGALVQSRRRRPARRSRSQRLLAPCACTSSAPPGSGTTTLGAALATRLGCARLDTTISSGSRRSQGFWRSGRSRSASRCWRARWMRQRAGCLSGSLCGWGDVFIPRFELVVFIYIPPEVRMARLAQREGRPLRRRRHRAGRSPSRQVRRRS
jgi:peptide/nickel transport system permease protein